jgi:hypothetical protein
MPSPGSSGFLWSSDTRFLPPARTRRSCRGIFSGGTIRGCWNRRGRGSRVSRAPRTGRCCWRGRCAQIQGREHTCRKRKSAFGSECRTSRCAPKACVRYHHTSSAHLSLRFYLDGTRAGRKPFAKSRHSGVLQVRNAARQKALGGCQLPPRATLKTPDAAPSGSARSSV